MKKIGFIIGISLILATIWITEYNIIKRVEWEANIKNLVFIIDPASLEDTIDKEKLFSAISKIGIQYISINFDDKVEDKLRILKTYRCFAILKLNPEKIIISKIEQLIKNNKDTVLTILINPSLGKKIEFSEKIKYQLANIIKKYNLFNINLEFHNFNIPIDDSYTIPTFRGLNLNLNKIDERTFHDEIFLKIKKSVFERNCSVVYITMNFDWDLYRNLFLISSVFVKSKDYFEKNNVKFGILPKSIVKPKFIKILSQNVTNLIIMLISILFPLLSYKYILMKLNERSKEELFFLQTTVAMMIGVICYGLLQDFDYIVMNKKVFGTKIMFLFPTILIFFIIFKKTDLEKISLLLKNTKTILFIFTMILLISYIFLRTGNVNKNFLLPYELEIRKFIEEKILFRPRFKETFFAHPLLILSLWGLRNNKESLLYKTLFCISIIGTVSIINTFLHIHTPLQISVLRTLLGVTLGWILGEFGVVVWQLVLMKIHTAEKKF